ncbi:hypothetical protein [uncultured Sphaerochaeta sp.]|uniref:hypothetical protein n=1 Tax=uncultured Sphaerochaeta sp. TaxID=886478 RepID=UPI002A0A6D1C|nr:hypothetical protein [uncultured Sphaerochaeta sp.]
MIFFVNELPLGICNNTTARNIVLSKGIEIQTFDRVCRVLEDTFPYPRVFLLHRFLGQLILGEENPAVLVSRSGWKLQGTDGVRGLVSGMRLSYENALSEFWESRILTADFCYIYAKAFIYMLGEREIPTVIAFGEDGRDLYGGGVLKQAIIAGLGGKGITIHDLGIVPTPFLAKYSLQNEIPAIMLTASHNPSCFNGIKIFMQGRKLYPEGQRGEYCLSGYFLAACEQELYCPEFGIPSPLEVIPTDPKNLSFLLASVDPTFSAQLKNATLLLDTANGAYTTLARNLFSELKIPIVEVACTPGFQKINSECGVGVLEDIGSEVFFSESLPLTVQKLFDAGRTSLSQKAYAIVLDGDGDRAFILEYKKERDCVVIHDGDALGYLLASWLQEGYWGKKRPLFISTIESDVSLGLSVKRNLNWRVKTTCVGDRWLVEDEKQVGEPFLGCERSGHLIIPISVKGGKSGEKEFLLCTGNGLLTALLALPVLLTDYHMFDSGYRNGISQKSTHLDGFYRGSRQWKQFLAAIRSFFPWDCREQYFQEEPDMLFLGLYESEDHKFGHCYMRKSGTEPKISIYASVEKNYRAQIDAGLFHLKQALVEVFDQE